MVRMDSKDINPYILNDDTNYKVNKSHYVIDEGQYRELHRKRTEAMQQVQALADRLGVDFTIPEPDVDGSLHKLKMYKEYMSNKEMYDEAFEQIFAICTPEMVLEYLKKLP